MSEVLSAPRSAHKGLRRQGGQTEHTVRAGCRAVPPFPAWRGYACMRVPVRGCACVPVRVYGWRLCARELACCVRCLLTRARTQRIVQRCEQATTSTNTAPVGAARRGRTSYNGSTLMLNVETYNSKSRALATPRASTVS